MVVCRFRKTSPDGSRNRLPLCCLQKLRAIFCLILIAFALAVPFHADAAAVHEHDMQNMFASMVSQIMAKINAETGSKASLRQASAADMRDTILHAFYESSALSGVDPDVHLVGLSRAQGPELSRFKPSDLASCYSEHKRDLNDFIAGIKLLGSRRNIAINWKSPKVQEACRRSFACLRSLADQEVCASASARFSGDAWSGEVRFSWYPANGLVCLYSVLTYSNHVNVKTVIISGQGKISEQKHKPFAHAAALSQYSLNMSLCSTEASGRWSNPEVPGFVGGSPLFVDNSCRLKISGTKVEGRVIETIMASKHSGTPWKIEYVLTGTADSRGNMNGTCLISGSPEAMQARLGRQASRAVWTASCSDNLIKGIIKIDNTTNVSWQAVIKK